MPIADKSFFTKESIERRSFNASSVLAEQAVHCLEMVAELVETGLNFQFKGGNSLLLILGEPKRFSIDVDVASDHSREEIEKVLDHMVSSYGVFTRWERRQHKTKPWLPLSSYYLYYNSLYPSNENASVMLDVQMRRSPYRTEFKKVTCGELYSCSSEVELPLPSSIISDKLLTLGPSTLGIPTGKGKEAQRLKHVYDVSRLLLLKPQVELMRESFIACLEQENSLQNSSYTVKEIVKDTLSFCWSVASYSIQPESAESVILAENAKGLAPFADHLFDPGYSWLDLRRNMAKVALCMSAVGNTLVTDDMLYNALSVVSCKLEVLPVEIEDSELAHYWSTLLSWWNNDPFWIEKQSENVLV